MKVGNEDIGYVTGVIRSAADDAKRVAALMEQALTILARLEDEQDPGIRK